MNAVKRTVLIFALVSLAVVSGAARADDATTPKPIFPEDVVFRSIDGKSTITVTNFRGRPVLLAFWASWCGPCRVELPELSKLYGELMGRGFVLITVNVDHHPSLGQRFLDSLGLNLPVYRVDTMTTKALGVDSLPTNILLDQDGRLVRAYKGYTPGIVDDLRHLVLEMTEPDES
jgi:thiol-disulfide isomerase/thioredoxin